MTDAQLARLLPPGSHTVPLGHGRRPSPLQDRPDMSADLGVTVSVKRDDLLDDLGSGHKVRKLDYVVAEALRGGATSLVTGGSLPSGQCVAVAAAARRYGLRSHLVYSGDEQRRPKAPQGSYLLALMLATEVTWHERTPWYRNAELLREACRREADLGHRPYPIPPGIAEWPGLLGSVELGVELAGQLPDADAAEEVHVLAPAGSGATCLGMAVAAHLLGRRWRVHGVCIGGNRDSVTAQIDASRQEAARRLGAEAVGASPVEVHADWLGDGYDRPTAAESEAMREALGRYGMPLDPNYMLKTFLGLRGLVSAGTIPAGARVVLVHTGGTFGLFGDSPRLQDWYRARFAPHLAHPGTGPGTDEGPAPGEDPHTADTAAHPFPRPVHSDQE